MYYINAEFDVQKCIIEFNGDGEMIMLIAYSCLLRMENEQLKNGAG